MSAIKVNFEIGHEASLRSKKTPEGFTHDWEVFVRGQEGADISHFVEKVVFHLHNTFPKPRRVVKEPPFSIKESGYAGFIFPIEIYLKNKDEPKKIKFQYDFTLQQSGFLKDRCIFENPSEEFRKKLLKGGGFPITLPNNAFYTNPDQESKSRDSFIEDKQHANLSKIPPENSKKQKVKEHKEEVPIRTSSFEKLFGPPIQKPPKVSPDPKKSDKNAAAKSDKKEKDRSNSEKKSKHEHKEAKAEKLKIKEEKDKLRSEKIKTQMKEQEKAKEKASKRPNERPPSTEPPKKRCVSPLRRVPSPAPRSSSSSSNKEEYKITKHSSDVPEPKKPKIEEKPVEIKLDKDVKEKKKKEKKSHDRDKERKEKKEHKKENHKLKESPKEIIKEIPKEIPKIKEIPKEKEIMKESPIMKEKMPKVEKPINKFSIENLRKTPPPEIEERTDNIKHKEKGESEKKHKHKKKDKKRDESREKHKESSKEKKHKYDKVRELPIEKPEIIERRETPIPKERCIPEPASPISIDTASQCSSKSGLMKPSHIGNDNLMNSSHSDSESSIIAAEEDPKVKIENPSPELIKHEPSPEPVPEPEPEPEVEPEPQLVVEPPPQQTKEKSKKHKDKSKREEKRRKRKIFEDEESENRKNSNPGESGTSYNGIERGESSGSMFTETKVQDNGVSSSLGEDAEPGDLSPDYMVRLRELQQRIMKIKNNEDLERVVNLIVETGRFEVTTQTFDFDLCLLDRSTVQQLIQLVGC